MSLSEIANLLDNKKFKVAQVASDGIAVLEETDKLSKMKLTINNLPQNSIYVKLPTGQEGFFIERQGHNYTKICDYLIFIPINAGKKYSLVYCELKNTLTDDNREHGQQQIKSTIPLVKYILSALEVHHNIKISITEHNVIIYQKNNIRTDKEKPRMTKNDTKKKEKEFVFLLCADAPLSIENLLN